MFWKLASARVISAAMASVMPVRPAMATRGGDGGTVGGDGALKVGHGFGGEVELGQFRGLGGDEGGGFVVTGLRGIVQDGVAEVVQITFLDRELGGEGLDSTLEGKWEPGQIGSAFKEIAWQAGEVGRTARFISPVTAAATIHSGEINFAVHYEIPATLARISSTGASRPMPS